MMTLLKKLYSLQRRMPTLLPGMLLILLIALPGSVFKPMLNMDLTMLSEIRKGANGILEIRLIDRLQAIKMLLEATGGDEEKVEGDAASLLKALVKAASENRQSDVVED